MTQPKAIAAKSARVIKDDSAGSGLITYEVVCAVCGHTFEVQVSVKQSARFAQCPNSYCSALNHF